MVRPRVYRTLILFALINLVTLVLANVSPSNWKRVVLVDLFLKGLGQEVNNKSNLELNDDAKPKAVGVVILNEDIPLTTTVKWIARYLNPEDNQYLIQAESETTGLCDFLVFQAAIAQMFFQKSNMTSCPFKKGLYVFNGSGPKEEAFPKKIPDGRDLWQIDVIAADSDRIVAHLIIIAKLIR